jgi:putative endonuclease
MMLWLGRLLDGIRHRARKRQWNSGPATGRRGEDIAHRFLQSQGYTIVARNFRRRSGAGEIDIIAQCGEATVFVEVKTRQSGEFGEPERAIGRTKQEAVRRTAREYCRRANIDPANVRFDTVSIVLESPPAIRHIMRMEREPASVSG